MLTLRLQLVDDGRGGGEHDRRDALEAQLGRLAHCADVRVRALGVEVDAGHKAIGGAHQGEAAHPLHHVLDKQRQRDTFFLNYN